MFNRSLSLLLACSLILISTLTPAASAKSRADKDAERTERVKAIIAKLAASDDARIVVKLRDGRKVAGHVREASEDSFVVAESSTSASTTVPYPDVAQIQGHHLSKNGKIAIIALSIAVGVLVFFLVLENTG